jgi:hypothetical protein
MQFHGLSSEEAREQITVFIRLTEQGAHALARIRYE